ncbi:MAG: DUF3303 domain-containing protein [Candidatus Bathyarchaeia archaeon]
MRELTKRSTTWKLPAGDYKILFPPHNVIGAKELFFAIETDDIEFLAKWIRPWTDISTWEISPIMDTVEFLALFGVRIPSVD